MVSPIGRDHNGPRIVAATNDGLLMQLDAKTGELVKSYGKNGVVDVKAGITEKFGTKSYDISAAPAIYKNLAIFAPSTGEQGRNDIAPGDPRAFDLPHGRESAGGFIPVPHPDDPNFGDLGTRMAGRIAKVRDLDLDRRGPGQRPGLRSVRQSDGSELRRKPPRHELLFEQPGGARCEYRKVEVVLSTRAPRHLRLGSELPSDTHRSDQEWQENPGRCATYQEGLRSSLRLTGEELFGVEERRRFRRMPPATPLGLRSLFR